MNENPNNSVNAAESSAPEQPTRLLSRLVGFTDRQFEHINAWLDEQVSYRKIAEYCLSEWQREVPHMTIARYAKRRMALTLGADLTDSKEAAAEISRYAATGDATFSTNTLEILEQQAFDLAAVYQRDNDAADLDTLKKITSVINQSRNTRVRERHATVQEQKIELRREELALKRELALQKTNTMTSNAHALHDATTPPSAPSNIGGTSSTSPTSISHGAITPANAAETNTNAPQPQPGNPTAISTDADDDDFDYENMPSISPNPLPPEVIARNLEFSRKLRAGKIIIDHSGPYVRAIEVSDILAANAALDRAAVPQNTEAPETSSNPNP